MSEEEHKTEKPVATDKKTAPESLFDKSKSQPNSTIPSANSKKYSLGLPHILLGILVIALISGVIGYSASKNHDFDNRFEKRIGLRGNMPMMGDDRELGKYSTGGGYGMGSDGTVRRGMFKGEAGTVNAVSSSSITIKPVQGGLTTFTIDSGTKVYNGTNAAAVSDLKTGQTVRIQADQADSTKASQITIE